MGGRRRREWREACMRDVSERGARRKRVAVSGAPEEESVSRMRHLTASAPVSAARSSYWTSSSMTAQTGRGLRSFGLGFFSQIVAAEQTVKYSPRKGWRTKALMTKERDCS